VAKSKDNLKGFHGIDMNAFHPEIIHNLVFKPPVDYKPQGKK
jgi:hypothetical protein